MRRRCCGDDRQAYARALAADPVSAYGGVVVLNRAVGTDLGNALAEQFVEVLFAPVYEAPALETLKAKQSLRILEYSEQRGLDEGERDYRRVLGGVLVQDRDIGTVPTSELSVVCGKLAESGWRDLLFAWTVVKHVTSNAIVLARDGQTLGIGAGQMSRVDAVRIAIEKARGLGHGLDGAVLASDAFFPFADGAQLALDAGVVAMIQPGGSKRTRRSSRRCRRRSRDGLHRPAALPPLTAVVGPRACRWCRRAHGAGRDDPCSSRERRCRSTPVDELRRAGPEARGELRTPGVGQVGHLRIAEPA